VGPEVGKEEAHAGGVGIKEGQAFLVEGEEGETGKERANTSRGGNISEGRPVFL